MIVKNKRKRIFIWGVIAIVFCYFCLSITRIFWYDTFVVAGSSMYPTLLNGDKVLVDKTIFGARIYNGIKSVSSRSLDADRLTASRSLQHNDIVVLNSIYPYDKNKIEFKINITNCKRIIGLPGDTLKIADGYYVNSSFGGSLGHIVSQKILSDIDDEFVNLDAFPKDSVSNWTIRNFGPMYIPAKGDTILIDKSNISVYHNLIEYETLKSLSLSDNETIPYIFKNNYYFVSGDDVCNSLDSRYYGLVPEIYIIGVITKILYSYNPDIDVYRDSRVFMSVL